MLVTVHQTSPVTLGASHGQHSNRSWPISTLLTLICTGLLAGRKSLASIQRYGQFLTQKQRVWLNFLPKLRGRPGRRAPSYKALSNLLSLLDPNALADTLQRWLAAHHGTLPRALAEAKRIIAAGSPLFSATPKIAATVG